MSEKPHAILRDWRVFGIDVNRHVLIGNVFGCPEIKDGTWVQTSTCLRIDFEKNEAETLNTIYKLEN